MQLVALERLPSIEGAVEILMGVAFLRGKAPLSGELSPKVTERLLQICGDLSVSAPPCHLPLIGEGFGVRKRIENLPAKRCRPANLVCTFYLQQIFYSN